MPGPASPAASPASADTAFSPTPWSVVLEARRDSVQRHAALEELCRAYWLPIYGYLRRRQHAPADAQDLTQSFLAYLHSSDFLERTDPAKGRFRGYLVGALRHFLGSHFEREGAVKRGGGAKHIEWTHPEAEREFAALDQPQLDPAEAYETTWAFTLLARALRRLETEQAEAKRERQYAVLKQFLSTSPTRGDYDRAAAELGTSRTNIAVWVHRLNHRYAELVKLEVAATVRDPTEVKFEMEHLFRTIRR
jgi:RNA polymerase sigma-70 factor (ECF subfamily)